ncbi:JAB domain-containing protein [Rhizobium chutanense]|uniref:JAB domain-containing protein n=1 Tax=Rhizobium chutanense TaxID=2035448 RepID=UPI003CC92AE4
MHRQHSSKVGNPTPSRTDIKTTKVIIDAAEAFDIIVHDHVIIGWDGGQTEGVEADPKSTGPAESAAVKQSVTLTGYR